MFKVTLNPHHPTGEYHRAGTKFTKEGTLLKDVPLAVKKDPWLKVEEITERSEPKDRKP